MLHLDCKSVYSYKESILSIEDIINQAIKAKQDTFSIIDINSLTGLIKATYLAVEKDLKFIQGLEMFVMPEPDVDEGKISDRLTYLYKEMRLKRTTEEMAVKYQEEIDDLEQVNSVPYHSITLIAKSIKGLKNIINIYNNAELHHDYYMVEEKVIFDNSDDIICLQGAYNSNLRFYLENEELDKSIEILNQYKEYFGENLYMKMEFDMPEELYDISNKNNIPLVLTNDCRHINKSDEIDYRLFKNIFSQTDIREFRDNSWFLSKEEFYELIKNNKVKEGFEEAYHNIQKINESCDHFWLPRAKELDDAKEELERKCYAGWKELRKGTNREEESLKRFKYELEVINEKGFSQYFLKVLRIVEVAYELGVLAGPARGSAAGSEICFLLKITKIDPLQYGLFFERFLNPQRTNYPDIDLDFASSPKITNKYNL